MSDFIFFYSTYNNLIKSSYHLVTSSYHLVKISYHLVKIYYHLVKKYYHLVKIYYHLVKSFHHLVATSQQVFVIQQKQFEVHSPPNLFSKIIGMSGIFPKAGLQNRHYIQSFLFFVDITVLYNQFLL